MCSQRKLECYKTTVIMKNVKGFGNRGIFLSVARVSAEGLGFNLLKCSGSIQTAQNVRQARRSTEHKFPLSLLSGFIPTSGLKQQQMYSLIPDPIPRTLNIQPFQLLVPQVCGV